MIVELDGNALLALVNGDAVAIGDHIVRPADENRITGLDTNAARPAFPGPGATGRGRTGRTGAHVINARFAGRCYQSACRSAPWEKGDRIVYDYDNRKAYCIGHGRQQFPHLREEVTA